MKQLIDLQIFSLTIVQGKLRLVNRNFPMIKFSIFLF
jgi:hypothetical protein